MFNKEKIILLQEEVNNHIKENETINSGFQKEIKALKQSNVDLKNTLDKILDTLDGDSFSKDWEEYQKYNEMKDKLPDIEEMYQLKRFKKLIAEIASCDQSILTLRGEILKLSGDLSNSAYAVQKGIKTFLSDQINIKENILHEIETILEYLRSKVHQKDLLESFKLYAISTEWLKP